MSTVVSQHNYNMNFNGTLMAGDPFKIWSHMQIRHIILKHYFVFQTLFTQQLHII